jgi:hypothetical protein
MTDHGKADIDGWIDRAREWCERLPLRRFTVGRRHEQAFDMSRGWPPIPVPLPPPPQPPPPPDPPAMTNHAIVIRLSEWTQHHRWCNRVVEAGDCNCGLQTLLLSLRAEDPKG